MLWFCSHKYGEVIDGYQYCKKCGKAIVAPCNHEWKIHNTNDLFSKWYVHSGTLYTLKCKNCGKITSKKIIFRSAEYLGC